MAASPIPVVSAVGHDTDFSLCDFAADARAATPTAAAALVTPERDAVSALVHDLALRASDALHNRLDRLSERLDRTQDRLRNSSAVIAPWRERLLRLQSRLQRATYLAGPQRLARLASSRQRLAVAMQRVSPASVRAEAANRRLVIAVATVISARTARLAAASQALDLLNPAHVLDRGYTLVFDHAGVPVTDAATLQVGSPLRIRFQRGGADANVTQTDAETKSQESG